MLQEDIVPCLQDIVESFRPLAATHQVQLTMHCKLQELTMVVDVSKTAQILSNLISNAIRFTPAGGKADVYIKRQLNQYGAASLLIEVSDTGIGIPAADLPHIFDLSHQANNSQTNGFAGAGLGLALVHELVKQVDAEIKVSSEPGTKTIFKVWFPIIHLVPANSQPHLHQENATNVDAQTTTGANKHLETYNGDAPHILLVDDNHDIVAYLKSCLHPAYQLTVAADGVTGLQKALLHLPDLIISNAAMPGMNGYDFSKIIRQDEKTSHIPILMLTAQAGEDENLSGLEAGVDAYLVKPFNKKELDQRIQNLVHLRKKMRERFNSATVIMPSEVSAVSADQAFIQKTLTIVEANIAEEQFNAELLAHRLFLSDAQLNRKLHALIGQPPGQLIRCMRLQRAFDLLQQGVGNVSEIAWQVGFSDQANFTRSFKKQFGIPPSELHKSANTPVS